MDIDIQDRIDRYLLGQMSSEECQAFEREMQEDAELKNQVEFTRNLQTAITSRGKKLDKIALWEHEAEESPVQEVSAKAKPQWLKLLYWSSGIAAVLIAGIIFTTLTGRHSVGLTGQDQQPLDGDGMVYRGGSDHSDIVDLIEQGSYDKALEKIEAEGDDIQKEMMSISAAESSEDAEYQYLVLQAELDALKWLEVKALLGLGDKDAAKAVLNQLRQKEGEYQAQADSLYNSLME